MSCLTRKKRPIPARFTVLAVPILILGLTAGHHDCGAWTIWDLNPWKQLRESRIFSLTRANPIGVRIMIVPVIDDPLNAPIYTRLGSEFANSLRSFANEVWMVTDLPNNPVKQGFYEALPRILADYRMRNRLSMDLLKQMMPDFECDYVALFEVTDYDRYWVDEDLQHRVGVRVVFYDYEDGEPRLEKYAEGGRGRRLEEGAFSEAERIAVKELVCKLERPLRMSILARECELQRRYAEMGHLAAKTGAGELAIHKYDLALMQNQIAELQATAREAEWKAQKTAEEVEYWKQQAESLSEEAEADDLIPPTVSAPSPMPILPRNPRKATPIRPVAAKSKPSPALPIPPREVPAEPSGTTSPVVTAAAPFDFDLELSDDLSGDWEYVGPETVPDPVNRPPRFPEVIRVE